MNKTSLRLRLLLAWAVFIAITLQVAGIGLRVLFERSITRRTQTELEADLRQLRRGMEVSPSGEIRIVREPTDPQFDIVLGGRYWQIEENGQPIVRSRSLDTASLTVTRPGVPIQDTGSTWLVGPDKEKLFAIVRSHEVAAASGAPERTLVIATAVDAAEIDEDANKFSSDLIRSLSVLAALFMIGAWMHVTIGLRPLKFLSAKVADVRAGRVRRLDGDYPDEVMALVHETNALLEGQDAALQEARARAGDLAHGLKTPLAIMAANARTLRRRGAGDVADEIDRQIESMRRHVDRELARARARGGTRLGLMAVDLVPLTDELVDVIANLPRDRTLSWDIAAPDSMLVSVDADDFNNIAGNVLENAGKWARSQVRVTLKTGADGAHLIVEDDGPGIAQEEFERVLRRGERADTSVAGSGLGLAIVNDLVTLYRGKLSLGRSALGGLSADVVLPQAREGQ